MTETVDTATLRKLLYNDTAVAVIRLRQALSAAADEVDRLRLAGSEWQTESHRAAQEAMRLRAVIGSAPHDDKCVHARFIAAGWTPQGRCTCWKADAL